MYQSVYTCYKTFKTHIRDDVKGWFEFDYRPQVYKKVKTPNEDSLPVLTGGYANPVEKYEKGNPIYLEQDLNRELGLLRDLYYKEDEKLPSWHNIIYLDIEIEIGGQLTKEYIRVAPMPITSIALIDKTTKTKMCFIVDTSGDIKEINEGEKHIISCKTEKELILKFLDKWEELDPTIIIGWNSAYFDIPYLYFRLNNVIGEEETLILSPIKKINVSESSEGWSIRIGGVNHLDYMLLHKKYITKQEPSYKLNDIGLKYVDLGKIEYEGNLNQLFKRDKEEFINYNLRDVEIIEKLEGKLKFIELTITLCHDCCVSYESVFYTTLLNEGKVLKFLKKKRIISNNKPTTDDPKILLINVGDEVKNHKGTPVVEGKVISLDGDIVNIETKSGGNVYRNIKTLKKNISYAGGYLLEPAIGLAKWGADFDASSHYPRIIIDLNIGAETLVGWIDNPDKYNCWLSFEELNEMNHNDRLKIFSPKGFSKEIEVEKLIDYIKTNNIIVAASGAMFRSDVKSILSEILEDGFNKRQEYKKIMKEAGKKGDWDTYNLYDIKSRSQKLFINGCYGALSLPTFRYSDGKYVLSKAVTLTGQRITQEVIREMNNYMEKDLNNL